MSDVQKWEWAVTFERKKWPKENILIIFYEKHGDRHWLARTQEEAIIILATVFDERCDPRFP